MTRRILPTVLAVGILASLTACGAQTATQAQAERIMTGKFHKISHEGTLRVHESTADGIVEHAKTWVVGEPEPTIIKEPKHLTLHRGCGNLSIGCNVDWDLKVRAGQNLEVEGKFGDFESDVELGKVTVLSVAGDVTLGKTRREASITLGSGNVSLTDTGGAVVVSTGKGNVNIDQPAGNVHVSAKEGNISVSKSRGDYVRAHSDHGNVTVVVDPINTSLDVKSGLGDVTIIVPQGSTFKIDAQAPLGTVHEQVARSNTGQITIKAVADNGSITIRHA